MKVLILF